MATGKKWLLGIAPIFGAVSRYARPVYQFFAYHQERCTDRAQSLGISAAAARAG